MKKNQNKYCQVQILGHWEFLFNFFYSQTTNWLFGAVEAVFPLVRRCGLRGRHCGPQSFPRMCLRCRSAILGWCGALGGGLWRWNAVECGHFGCVAVGCVHTRAGIGAPTLPSMIPAEAGSLVERSQVTATNRAAQPDPTLF
jgi:hypothetical protein